MNTMYIHVCVHVCVIMCVYVCTRVCVYELGVDPGFSERRSEYITGPLKHESEAQPPRNYRIFNNFYSAINH